MMRGEHLDEYFCQNWEIAYEKKHSKHGSVTPKKEKTIIRFLKLLITELI